MKNLIWIAALTLLCASGKASIVYFDSSAASTTNSTASPTLDLIGAYPPDMLWAPALVGSNWISFGPTGDGTDPGFTAPPNGTIVMFTTQFLLSGFISDAHLMVLADDTTTVVLNGHAVYNANLTPGPTCAAGQIGCLTSTEGVFTFADMAPFLVDGNNTLSFAVVQVNGSSFGLDFAGDVEAGATAQSPTPEPSTLAFIAGGLIAFAILRKRR